MEMDLKRDDELIHTRNYNSLARASSLSFSFHRFYVKINAFQYHFCAVFVFLFA